MSLASLPLELSGLRPWTVSEYHQMAKTGILQSDERVELIAGQIIRTMTPQGSPHAAAITRTHRVLSPVTSPDYLVRVQLPIHLDQFSEPEPDLALVKYDPLDYDDRHPRAEDVYLLVEIADSTLTRDLTLKQQLYAQAGIQDYWVLNLAQSQLHIHRQPSPTGYQTTQILLPSESVSPLLLPTLTLTIATLFKPRLA